MLDDRHPLALALIGPRRPRSPFGAAPTIPGRLLVQVRSCAAVGVAYVAQLAVYGWSVVIAGASVAVGVTLALSTFGLIILALDGRYVMHATPDAPPAPRRARLCLAAGPLAALELMLLCLDGGADVLYAWTLASLALVSATLVAYRLRPHREDALPRPRSALLFVGAVCTLACGLTVTLLTLMLVGHHVPGRVPLTAGPAPTLDRLTGTIAAADAFSDGLRRTTPAGTVMSEYYALPVSVRVDDGPWRTAGSADTRTRPISRSPTHETEDLAFDAPGVRNALRLRVAVDWAGDGFGRWPLSIEVFPRFDDRRLQIRFGDRIVATMPANVQRPTVRLTLDESQRDQARSARYTLRHATEQGAARAAWLGRTAEASSMWAAVRHGRLTPGVDVYAPLWNVAPAQEDDEMPFRSSVYADCVHGVPPDERGYEYRSKTCRLPMGIYRWATAYDPLVRLSVLLHVLQRRGPEATFATLDRKRVRFRDELARMEQLFRRVGTGMPQCTPLSCDVRGASGVRTFLFGAIEAELGYRHGDRIARGYADAVARIALRVQIGPGGWVPSDDGKVYRRPLTAGGIFERWQGALRNGRPPSLANRALQTALQGLDMPAEYAGFVPSNAETTLTGYAFLLRYRCARYGVGCRGAQDTTVRPPGDRAFVLPAVPNGPDRPPPR